MSEVNLIIIDCNRAIQGEAPCFLADAAVAALTAEPETIAELETALERYIKPVEDKVPFASFHDCTNAIDTQPWNSGVIVIDLASRFVAAESTCCSGQPQGTVTYNDGTANDVQIQYCLSNDWCCVSSLDAYTALHQERRCQRATVVALDTRAVLYGRSLTEFIVWECFRERQIRNKLANKYEPADENQESKATSQQLIKSIHARWLMTPREDLQGRTPREVLLEKLEFINFDLHTRALQWSMLGEGPPTLSKDSFAFKYAGFGTNECVVYHDLVRHLLRRCWRQVRKRKIVDVDTAIAWLEKCKLRWLEEPHAEYDGKIPALIAESERRRLPMATTPEILDPDCPICQMLADQSSVDFTPTFWALDSSDLEEDFVFSVCRTREEWEADRQDFEQFTREFNEEWQQKITRLSEPLDNTDRSLIEEPSIQ